MAKVKVSSASSVQPDGSMPALGFSYSVTLDDKRSIVLQTHIPIDATVDALNEILDKMRQATDRQAAHFRIADLKRSLHMQQKQLRRVTEDLHNIDAQQQASFTTSGKKGQFRLTSEQEKHRQNVLITQQRFNEEIEEIKREIKAAEELSNATYSGSTG